MPIEIAGVKDGEYIWLWSIQRANASCRLTRKQRLPGNEEKYLSANRSALFWKGGRRLKNELFYRLNANSIDKDKTRVNLQNILKSESF